MKFNSFSYDPPLILFNQWSKI